MPIRRGRVPYTAGILTIVVVAAIGVIIGLALMMPGTQAQPASSSPTTPSGMGVRMAPPPQNLRTQVRETIVVNQPEPETLSPFLYENTRELQRPPVKPFYLPTRGEPYPYQQIGILIGEERGGKGEQIILPLIGRQTHPGSSRYHYYTSSNGYHPMKLPVEHKKRTCNDSTGCEEIFSGNLVRVRGYDIDFQADVYPSADPVYIL